MHRDTSSPHSDITENTMTESIVEVMSSQRDALSSALSENIQNKKSKLKCTEVSLERKMKPISSYKSKKSDKTISKKETIVKDVDQSKGQKTSVTLESNIDVHMSQSSKSVAITKTSSRVFGYMQSTVSRNQKIGKTGTTVVTNNDIPDKVSSLFKDQNSPKLTPKKMKAETNRNIKPTEMKNASNIKQGESLISKTTKNLKNQSLIPVAPKSKISETDRNLKKSTNVSTSSRIKSTGSDMKFVERSFYASNVGSATVKSRVSSQMSKVQKTSTALQAPQTTKETSSSKKTRKIERKNNMKKELQESSDDQTKEEANNQKPIKKPRRGKISTTVITQADVSCRSQSALYYASKDCLTFDHSEISSSMPSSPNHLKRPDSSNGNSIITSEVFTRTIESPKSVESVIQKPMFSDSSKRVSSEADTCFTETTDSSLSDSMALPISDLEGETIKTIKKGHSSPIPTNAPLPHIDVKNKQSKVISSEPKTGGSKIKTSTTSSRASKIGVKSTTIKKQTETQHSQIFEGNVLVS